MVCESLHFPTSISDEFGPLIDVGANAHMQMVVGRSTDIDAYQNSKWGITQSPPPKRG